MFFRSLLRRQTTALGLCVWLGVFGGAVCAAEGDLDTDLMQAIEDTNKDLASNVALQDAKAATANAQELHDMFRKVEAHFQAKGDANDAVGLSHKSQVLTEQIIKSVGDKDFSAATDSATELSRTCRACHTFYKKS